MNKAHGPKPKAPTPPELWVPKTRLGRLVTEGKITTMHDALISRLPLRETQIVDVLLPNLEEEVIDVNMVQRMTDSGRRVKFSITTVIGNSDGFIGLGRAKYKEVGPAIRKATENAKLHIIEIKRGCGSWECGCGKPHTLPIKVIGQSGSVRVVFKPAPQGVGLAIGDVAKSIMRLAGIKDVWGFAYGHTKTMVNYALATFNALASVATTRIPPALASKLKIVEGSVAPPPSVPAPSAQEVTAPQPEEQEKLPPEE